MPNTIAHFVGNKNGKINNLPTKQSLRRRFASLVLSFCMATSFGVAVSVAAPQNSDLHVGSILPGKSAKSEKTSAPTNNAAENATRTVKIQVDGETRTVETSVKTVRELFKSEEIVLGKQDRCSVPLDTPLSAKTDNLIVTRLKIEIVKERTEIPFETKRQLSPRLRAGETKTVQTGKNGAKVVTYRVVTKNGETSTTKVSEKTQKPRHELIHSGMRGMSFSALASRGSFSGARILTMRATGYGPGDNGKWGARTASGMKPGFGVVAVDPRFIRLGTRLYVEGYGYAIAGDTGGAIKGNRIDLGYDTHYEAAAVGRKSVRVMILQ